MNDRIANDRIALATTDASVAVLSTAVEAFYEADFCSNCLQHAHQLRVFAVRTERAFTLMGRRQDVSQLDAANDHPVPETVLV